MSSSRLGGGKQVRCSMFLSRPFLTASLVLALCFAGCEKKTDAPAGEKPTEKPTSEPKAEPGKIDRTMLPVLEPKPPTYTELDARDVTAPPTIRGHAPKAHPTS